MKTHRHNRILVGMTGFLASCMLSASSFGATMFSESFDGADGTASFGSNFTLPGSPGNYKIQGNQAANPGVNFSQNEAVRRYVSTVDADYATADFIAEITMSFTSQGNFESAYFGIGSGVASDGWGSGTPDGALYVTLLENESVPYIRFSQNKPGQNVPDSWAFGEVSSAVAGNSRLRMVKTGNNLQFFVDSDSTTFVAADATSNLIDLTALPSEFSGWDSRLFFGGGRNVTWDDFSVTAVPEPSSFALLLFGSVGVGMVRRRKK